MCINQSLRTISKSVRLFLTNTHNNKTAPIESQAELTYPSLFSLEDF